MKIIIMGLPGSGKTFLTRKLGELLNYKIFHGDSINRESTNIISPLDHRLKIVLKLKDLAEKEIQNKNYVICDYFFHTQHLRDIFEPDIIIWVYTHHLDEFKSTFHDFEKPKNADFIIRKHMNNNEMIEFAENLKHFIEGKNIS